mmetsp:Transcript_52319/g.122725  ORF Transcript_52319/g.122725 Transcript_52319/m.122725 type:complete len:348 (+) Transcript_52319:143-1186(+)
MPKNSPTYATWDDTSDEESYLSISRLIGDDKEDGWKSDDSSHEKEVSVLCEIPAARSTSPAVAVAESFGVCPSPPSPTPSLPAAIPCTAAPAPGRNTRFTSMKCTFQLNQPVDLSFLAKHIPGGNCVFDRLGYLRQDGLRGKKRHCMPNQARLYVRMKGRRKDTCSRAAALTIFANGSICISGARNYGEVVRVSKKVVERIRRTVRRENDRDKAAVQYPQHLALAKIAHADENGIRADMVRSDFDLRVSVRLHEAYKLLQNQFKNVEYEPETFPGLMVKPSANTTMVIFATGRGFVSGCDVEQCNSWLQSTENSLNDAFSQVYGVLLANWKTVANLSSLRRSKIGAK